MTATPAPTLRQDFLEGMSHTACTVNVVTTDGVAGRAGVTVSAMSSVSADGVRPTLLVCVHHQSPAAQKIVENGVFCVNVLQDHQAYISDTFAGRRKTGDGDKFSCAAWTTEATGAPRVIDPLVAFDCRVASSERVGTHHVFIGEVEAIFTAKQGSPLIFAKRAYGSTARIQTIGAPSQETTATLAVACFHTFGPFVLPELVARMKREAPGTMLRVIEGDQRTITASLLSGESELGLLYDLELTDGLDCEVLAEVEPYVLLAEGHPLAAEPVITPERLLDEPMVLLDAPPSRNYFLSIFEDSGRLPVIAFASSSFEMVRGMVGHGLGFALLATRPAAPMTYDGKALVTRKLDAEASPSRIVLGRKRGIALSDAAQHFIRNCRDVFEAKS
ncbi:MAG: LysR substrate-binding domain-containing protein [Alphaproteobacteria bacterium]